MTTKLLPFASTPLERHVARWIDSSAQSYSGDEPTQGVLDDLAHGCSSGIVSELTYTRDCVKFYRKFRSEIDGLFYQLQQELGEFELNGWDKEDPFAREDQNQNTLAWFGFEEAAHILANKAGLDS